MTVLMDVYNLVKDKYDSSPLIHGAAGKIEQELPPGFQFKDLLVELVQGDLGRGVKVSVEDNTITLQRRNGF